MQVSKIKNLQNFSSQVGFQDINLITYNLHNDESSDKSSDSSSNKKSIHKTSFIIKIKNSSEWVIKQPKQYEIELGEHINEVVCADVLRLFDESIAKTRIATNPENNSIFILSKRIPGDTLENFLNKNRENFDLYKEKFIEMHILNAILGNTDLHRNNFIINEKALIAIDFGRSFHTLNSLKDNSYMSCGLFNKGCMVRGVKLDSMFKCIPTIVDAFESKLSEVEIVIQTTYDQIESVIQNISQEDFMKQKMEVIQSNIQHINKVCEIYNSEIVQNIKNYDVDTEILEKFRNLNIEDKKIAVIILKSLLSEKQLLRDSLQEYESFEKKINSLIISHFQKGKIETMNVKDIECFFITHDKEEFIKEVRGQSKDKLIKDKSKDKLIRENCEILSKIKNIFDKKTLNDKDKLSFQSFNEELKDVIVKELERTNATDKINLLKNQTFQTMLQEQALQHQITSISF